MSLYQAMVNRFVIPVIEKHRDEGRVEGRAEERADWREWNRRRHGRRGPWPAVQRTASW